MKTDLLIDSNIMPSIWFYLTFKSLNFEPLYRYDCTKITSVIPYIIQLDNENNPKVVNELLTKKDYQKGLVIQSENTLVELADKLGYFYHVINRKNEPFLRRFFDLRYFPQFVKGLSSESILFLFNNKTSFYYLDSDSDFYHYVYYEKNVANFKKIGFDELKEKIR